MDSSVAAEIRSAMLMTSEISVLKSIARRFR
jgi:hypothetical protein